MTGPRKRMRLHPVLRRLLLWHPLQQQLWGTGLARQQEDVLARRADPVIAEGRRPEAGQCLRIAAIEHQADAVTGKACLSS